LQSVAVIPSDNKLPGAVEAELAEHANEIRRLGKRTGEDIVAIGDHLIAARAKAGHGNWLPWLKREFNWSDQTARRFMQVAEASKNNNLLNLDLGVSALYLLSDPSTPAEVAAEVVKDAAESGRKITTSDITKAKAAHKRALTSPAPSKPKSTKAPPERDPYEVLRARIFERFSDEKGRTASAIGAALQVAASAVKQALKGQGGGRLATRINAAGETEYVISSSETAELRRSLINKDLRIAELEAQLVERDRQLAAKAAMIAGLEARIEALTTMRAVPSLAEAAN
jgi:predicted transcriptional regulator